MQILSGHVSQETAYLVEDYPYGFRLRCKIRYWLEYRKGKGVRFCSQTTNPKRGDIWNKEKCSTYCRFGGCMFLDEQNHVTWTGLSEYSTYQQSLDFRTKYESGIPADMLEELNAWIEAKRRYEENRK